MRSPSRPGLVSLRRLWALCRKETWQILRDPSSNVIAFVLPVVMLLIFSHGINLDSTRISVGLLLEDTAGPAREFAEALRGSAYLRVIPQSARNDAFLGITAGQLRGVIVVPSDFSTRVLRAERESPVQVITDGAEPNIATFLENYSRGIWQTWIQRRAREAGQPRREAIRVEARAWFNPSQQSRNYLIPGSISLIMTVVGALMTSLVVAREWERGTMEALLATPITRTELLLSKVLPYYVLGMVSLLICVAVAVFLLGIPFRGSILLLLALSTFFLLSALGLGLLLSTVTRNQFDAAQAALSAAFLPAMMLSGFIYEIASMPRPIQWATYLVPARYFVVSLQTLFQAGDVPGLLWPNLLFLVGAAVLFLGLTARKTRRRLD